MSLPARCLLRKGRRLLAEVFTVQPLIVNKFEGNQVGFSILIEGQVDSAGFVVIGSCIYTIWDLIGFRFPSEVLRFLKNITK